MSLEKHTWNIFYPLNFCVLLDDKLGSFDMILLSENEIFIFTGYRKYLLDFTIKIIWIDYFAENTIFNMSCYQVTFKMCGERVYRVLACFWKVACYGMLCNAIRWYTFEMYSMLWYFYAMRFWMQWFGLCCKR